MEWFFPWYILPASGNLSLSNFLSQRLHPYNCVWSPSMELSLNLSNFFLKLFIVLASVTYCDNSFPQLIYVLSGKKKEKNSYFLCLLFFSLQFHWAPSNYSILKKYRIIIPYLSPSHSQFKNLYHTFTRPFSRSKGPAVFVEDVLDINTTLLFKFC